LRVFDLDLALLDRDSSGDPGEVVPLDVAI